MTMEFFPGFNLQGALLLYTAFSLLCVVISGAQWLYYRKLARKLATGKRV